jgi:hypothetical protein
MSPKKWGILALILLLAAVILTPTAIIAGRYWQLWSRLELAAKAKPATPEKPAPAGSWIHGGTQGEYQVGWIELGNGEVWRFAFLSHHQLLGEDSYSVFTGPAETWRVKGSGFCCEVDFGDSALPATGDALIKLLRRCGGELEKAP